MPFDKDLTARAHIADDFHTVIRVHFWKFQDGKRHVLLGDRFEVMNENQLASPEHGVAINFTAAQTLMDSLWDCGIRPTRGTESAGALAATQNHLGDMQIMTTRLLAMIEHNFHPVVLQSLEERRGE